MRIIGALEKAQIIIHGEYTDETIKCSINPSQYVLKNSVSYKEDTDVGSDVSRPVSYTHLDVYKRQHLYNYI